MNEKRQITNETILYAHAVQIAIALSKQQPVILKGNEISMEKALDVFNEDAKVIYRYLLNH